VSCGVRPVLCKPDPSTPDHGTIDLSVQFSSTSDPMMFPVVSGGGRYPADALVLATRLSRVLEHNPRVLDPTTLCVEPGKAVWCVRCEISVLANDGCLFDACLLAAAAALEGCPLVARIHTPTPSSALHLTTRPGSASGAIVEGRFVVCPTAKESQLADCAVSIVTDEGGMVLDVELTGAPGISEAQIEEVTACAAKRACS
jgi:exosome complex component RRP43